MPVLGLAQPTELLIPLMSGDESQETSVSRIELSAKQGHFELIGWSENSVRLSGDFSEDFSYEINEEVLALSFNKSDSISPVSTVIYLPSNLELSLIHI